MTRLKYKVAAAVYTALALSACSTPQTVYRDRPVEVKVPVSTPCASLRPDPVPTLVEAYPQWDALDVRQKAAAVARHALDLRTYGEQLNAATAACPEN